MGEDLSRQELEAAHCWEADDHVPRRPEMTDFRRRLRLHQAHWREANGHPIGSQPIVPRPGGSRRPVESRLPLDYARDTGATFLTAAAHEATKARTSVIEPHQSFDHQRLWAELLWSAALAFNLFGDLAADLRVAGRPSAGCGRTYLEPCPTSASCTRRAGSILPGSETSSRSTSRSCSTSATAPTGSSGSSPRTTI